MPTQIFQSLDSSVAELISERTNSFFYKAADLSLRNQVEAEPNFIRFQVNDSYIAYTGQLGGREETNDHIVIKNSIYAVK
jgi:hypothetical protein